MYLHEDISRAVETIPRIVPLDMLFEVPVVDWDIGAVELFGDRDVGSRLPGQAVDRAFHAIVSVETSGGQIRKVKYTSAEYKDLLNKMEMADKPPGRSRVVGIEIKVD